MAAKGPGRAGIAGMARSYNRMRLPTGNWDIAIKKARSVSGLMTLQMSQTVTSIRCQLPR